jgi:hypothetical protein
VQILEQPYVQQHMQRWLQEQEQRVLSSTVKAPRVQREVKRSLSRMASDKVTSANLPLYWYAMHMVPLLVYLYPLLA